MLITYNIYGTPVTQLPKAFYWLAGDGAITGRRGSRERWGDSEILIVFHQLQ